MQADFWNPTGDLAPAAGHTTIPGAASQTAVPSKVRPVAATTKLRYSSGSAIGRDRGNSTGPAFTPGSAGPRHPISVQTTQEPQAGRQDLERCSAFHAVKVQDRPGLGRARAVPAVGSWAG